MGKTTWRDRLKSHGFTLWAFTWRRTMVRSRVDGEWVSARRVSVVIAKLERERDEARAEVERLRGEIVRSEKAKLHLIAKLKEQQTHPLSDAVIAEMWPDMNSVERRAEIRRQYDALIAAEREGVW